MTEEQKLLEAFGNYICEKQRQFDSIRTAYDKAVSDRDKSAVDSGGVIKEVLDLVFDYMIKQNPKSMKHSAGNDIWEAIYTKYSEPFLKDVCPRCRAIVKGVDLSNHTCVAS